MESCLQSKIAAARRNHSVFWLCLGLAWLGLSPLAVAKWWDGQCSIRKKITIDLSPQATGIKDSVGGAVLLVRLHDGNFQFSAAKKTGATSVSLPRMIRRH